MCKEFENFYRLMLSGLCTAHRTRAEKNRYCFEIRRYWPWEKERTIKTVARFYYTRLGPGFTDFEAEEVEK